MMALLKNVTVTKNLKKMYQIASRNSIEALTAQLSLQQSLIQQVGAKQRFNEAHTRTRNTVERSFGVLKNRFYSLKTGLRVREMEFAAKLVICAAIVHNLCIDDDDDGQDFDDGDGGAPANQEAPVQANLAPVETRRQQLLQVFQ